MSDANSNPPAGSIADPKARLRSRKTQIPFNIVLVCPEIPPNTGNIGRLCAATGAHLHLVEPLGFRIDEHAVRRAGLDYWHLVSLTAHASLDDAKKEILTSNSNAEFWYFTGKTSRSYLTPRYKAGDALVFGRESTGLPEQLLQENPKRTVAIPTLGAVRSLNLSNSVAIGLYEALRQVGELSNLSFEP